MNRLRRLNPSIPIVGILLALTAILRLINLTGSPARLDDEGTYVAQAYAVAHWGEIAHYTYWYDHPPAGWLQLALWTAISGPDFGGNAVAAGRYLMVAVAVLTAGLLWLLARRVDMSRWASAAAVVIFAVSPLSIALSRTVYLDNLAIAWLLTALVLICSPRHRLSAMFGAAACFGVAVLTKETMLLFAPMVVWLVWTRTSPTTRRYALAVFGTVFTATVSTYVLMAVVRGELIPGPGHVSLWQGIKFQLWERAAGGAITDPGSLKRHTVDEWFVLDPALPVLAVPVAVAAFFVDRLRPFAVGLMILIATIVRPGYLPVPFVLSVVPLAALLIAGTGEVAVRYLRRPVAQPSVGLRRSRRLGLAAGTLIVAIVASLWLPSYRSVLHTDDDAPMQQAQQWIEQNVPKDERLIVDDALWVDLVRDGRDRRNVIWAYKVDTDEQVRSWAPRGWASHDWVVSTPSMRADMRTNGVLNDAISHARPAATFGTGGKRVDVLRVDNGSPTSKPATPAAPAFSGQLAARLAGHADPDALAALQSRTVDQRILATLAVVTAAEPIVLKDLPVSDVEQVAGTPRREMTLTGPHDQLQGVAAFFERQVGPFAVESVAIDGTDLKVRFPFRTKDIGLGPGLDPPRDGAAMLRVADLRRGAPAETLDLIRVDGTAAGSLQTRSDVNPLGYRSVPAGTYVATTHAGRGAPVIRQVLTLDADAAYTLALFSQSESNQVVGELAQDGQPAVAGPDAQVRLMQAAGAVGSVNLTLTPNGPGTPTVLANTADYSLVTGYAALPAGQYTAVVTAAGREVRLPVDLVGGEPTSFLLTDGPDGPRLQTLRDVPDAPVGLDPSTPMAFVPEAPAKNAPVKPLIDVPTDGRGFVLVGCVVVIVGAAILMSRARPRRRTW
ncbi:glycosyltransferase family 39 protein [Mycobacterium sp. URHB0044]|uniref:glycosyltransferase family 39 protein n=1 Tax=Mycobacterium sp. URHB0044 TaxID=1380386 RepID=UPI000568DCF3|nr:glycosyltransferase family 39 protein [Mycobacterium sp. URHB0044]